MEAWVVSTGLIFLYLAATVVIGVVANRRGSANMEDFFLYGRQAGFIVLYLTVVATFHSAFAFLGSGGFFYTHGIGFWMAGTWTVLVGAITYTIGTRIWALGKKFGYITPADMLADFYESETVRVIVAAVSVLFTLVYIQVQSAGLGYILSVATGDRISFELASAILLVVAAGYLMVGGLRAVYWTDVIQGIWMYAAVWGGSLLLTYKLFGGPVALWRRLAAERPEMLSLPGPEGFFTPGMWFGMTIALSFGIIFQPHMDDPVLHGRVEQDPEAAGGHHPDLPHDALHPGCVRGAGRRADPARSGRAGPRLPGAAVPLRAAVADRPDPGRGDRRSHVRRSIRSCTRT